MSTQYMVVTLKESQDILWKSVISRQPLSGFLPKILVYSSGGHSASAVCKFAYGNQLIAPSYQFWYNHRRSFRCLLIQIMHQNNIPVADVIQHCRLRPGGVSGLPVPRVNGPENQGHACRSFYCSIMSASGRTHDNRGDADDISNRIICHVYLALNFSYADLCQCLVTVGVVADFTVYIAGPP